MIVIYFLIISCQILLERRVLQGVKLNIRSPEEWTKYEWDIFFNYIILKCLRKNDYLGDLLMNESILLFSFTSSKKPYIYITSISL